MLLISPATPSHPHGHIRYLNRGLQIIRPSSLGLWVPVPGWTGEHDWHGLVKFEELPRGEGGKEGKIVTANNPIVGSGWEYGALSVDYVGCAASKASAISESRVLTCSSAPHFVLRHRKDGSSVSTSFSAPNNRAPSPRPISPGSTRTA